MDSPASTTPNQHRWIVAQIGAREHYAVARALAGRGDLKGFYTDAWCKTGRRLLMKGPAPLRALAGRWHPDIPSDRVVGFTKRALWNAIIHRGDGSVEAAHLEHIRIGRQFAQSVTRKLRRSRLNPASDVYFGYDTGCFETLEYLNDRKIFSIVDQIDPAIVEEEIVLEESRRWPGWQKMPGRVPQAYWDRLRHEWNLATRVLVNSEWSKAALQQQGVPEHKIGVVPLAYEPESVRANDRPPRRPDEPLRVLFLGSVILRKGIQYLIEASKQIVDENVRIIVAGSIGISEDAVRSAPKNVEFIGRVTRERTAEVYREADVFVLPTVSDGFAITQLEAMSHGLAVIATPNCGEVVSEGVDGMIVPARDATALASAIVALARNTELLNAMRTRALEKSRQFSLEQFAHRLQGLVG